MKVFSIREYYDRKIKKPFKSIFKKNTPPEKLALAFTLGITVGIIPFYGFITLLISVIALSLRLNVVAVNFAHYIVHPIQIALFMPFFKMGKLFYHKEILPSSFKEFVVSMKTDFWDTLHNFWLACISAIGIWLIISIPLGLALYFLFVYLLKRRTALKTIPVK